MSRYVFDVDDLSGVVESVLARHGDTPLLETLDALTSALAERYPGQIEADWEWIFSVDGGGSQQLAVLHTGLSEYLALVGMPIPTDGYSGRYRADIYDIVIDGHLENYPPGQIEPDRYSPGDVIFTPRGGTVCWSVSDRVWTLEYARGLVPSMFALPVVDTVFGTLDYRSLFRLVKTSTRQLLGMGRGRPVWHNWMGNRTASPEQIWHPESLDDLRHVVTRAAAEGRRVRAFGDGHSWSDIVANPDFLVDITGLDRCLDIDTGSGRITVQAGMRLQKLLDIAARYDLMVLSPTVATSFTIGGMVATGSHGTGMRHDRGEPSSTFSDTVVGMTLVTASGEVVEVTDPDTLRFARVALGSLGLIYSVTIQCAPAVNTRCEDRYVPFSSEELERIPDYVENNDAVAVFWYPYTDKLWLKLWNATDDARTYGWFDRQRDRLVQYTVEGGGDIVGNRGLLRWFPALTPFFLRIIVGFAHDRTTVKGPVEAFHYQFVYPKVMDSSHAIPLDHAVDAWKDYVAQIRAQREKGQYPINMVVHSRFVDASHSVLSPAYERNTCFIEAVTQDGTPYDGAFYQALHRRMVDEYDGRVHWAKIFDFDPLEVIRDQYRAQLEEFELTRRAWDPNGMFLNDFLERLFAPFGEA